MLGDYGYRHTVSACDNYCLSTARVVTRTRLNVTFTRALSVLLRHFLKIIAYVEILCVLTSSGVTSAVHTTAVFVIVNLKISPSCICRWLHINYEMLFKRLVT